MLVGTAIGLVGCNRAVGPKITASFRDAQLDQPWTSPGYETKGVASRVQVSDELTSYKYEWSGGVVYDEKTGDYVPANIDADTVTDKCERYLKRHGSWAEPQQMNVLNPRYSDVWSNPNEIHAGLNYVWTIVCVDPIVVIGGPGKIHYNPNIIVNELGARQARDGVIETDILLNRGFAYGSILPYSDSPYWFSPDMNVPPTQSYSIASNIRGIRVPWGELVMHRQGANWVVYALRN